MPDTPAPTEGQVANVMRIRDELALRISKVKAPSADYGRNAQVGKLQARNVAEALIEQGLVNLERVHLDIINGTDNDDDDLFEDGE